MTDFFESCNILTLDTTSKNCSISLLNKEKILLEYNFVSDNNLSSILIPSIEFILENMKIKIEEIDVFGITIGPGLFTGIRIGLSTLKGMIFNNPKPVVPINNLEALAHKFKQLDFPIVSIIDAKRDEIYIGGYDFRNKNKIEIFTPDLIHIREITSKLNTLDNFHFTGGGTLVHKDYLKENFKNNKKLPFSSFLASEIGKMTYKKYLQKNYILNPKDLRPYYLRKPDAETKQFKI